MRQETAKLGIASGNARQRDRKQMNKRPPTLDVTTAVEMARQAGVDPKRFRAALRDARLGWHPYNGRWDVVVGSPEHRDMEMVLKGIGARRAPLVQPRRNLALARPGRPAVRDETYVLDLCDEVLGQMAVRQHRFPFLLGDPGINGQRRSLPVDAFYPALNLVVEYQERQHTERVGFFDDKPTISGIGRGEQRRRYDELRRTLLPERGYDLVCLEYGHFAHDAAKRLRRTSRDRAVVEAALCSYVQIARKGRAK
jgi:hypothetical protein